MKTDTQYILTKCGQHFNSTQYLLPKLSTNNLRTFILNVRYRKNISRILVTEFFRKKLTKLPQYFIRQKTFSSFGSYIMQVETLKSDVKNFQGHSLFETRVTKIWKVQSFLKPLQSVSRTTNNARADVVMKNVHIIYILID